MSTIDEVLAAAEVVDAVCVIDGETRIISVPTEYKELGVESDEKVTRVKFQCPKIVGDNIDLTEYNLYINYRNAGNKLNSYLVEDVTVTDDTINFSWLLSRHVTENPGTISYIVCAKKSDDTGVINEWNTKVATGIVGIGLEATEEIEEQNIDAIEQILRSIVELENKIDGGGSGGSGIAIDETLTEQGKAADAKATGDAIHSLSGEIANIPSGKDGADGQDGITPTIGENGNWYLGDTDTGKPSRGEKGDEGQPGKDGQDGSPGKDGNDGQPGKDGTSPVISVSAITGGHRITITDANGTKTVDVMDGSDGKNGADGQPGADGSNGQNGQDGSDGVGIQSVEQTTTSTEDGGTNVVTVTKTDGTSSTFSVKNGSKGSKGDNGGKGDKGADGKSAYQYAVEGGYTKTEAEFAKKLASGALIVTITDNDGTLSADKTYSDIWNAILAGISVLVVYDVAVIPLIGIAGSLFFGTFQCNSGDDGNGAVIFTLIIEITENNEVNDLTYQIDIPKTLPNPKALTFTGAVTGSYDGSAPLSVKIPSTVTDDHINSLIDTKLGVIENGSY